MDCINYLTLVMTYQCSARCAHCCIGAGPDHGDWMTLQEADRYLGAVVQHGKIGTMTLIGGEAFLNLDRTIEIGKAALSHGIKRVEVETNSSWALDVETARCALARIRDAGLTIGSISLDSFHQAHVPRQNVLHFLQAAKDTGFPHTASCVVVQPGEPANPHDLETLALVRWLSECGFEARINPLVFHGRAAQLARHHTGPWGIPADRCPGVYFFGTSDWRRPGGVQLDSAGWVMLEHGICIGNARQRDLLEILDAYDPDAHPIIRVLMRDGPLGLTRLSEAEGFQLREEGYVDKCQLCQEIRTYLRPLFPHILGPDSYYP